MSEPTYIYKLVSCPPDLADPASLPLPETLPLSQLDEKDNFMHFSTSVQVPQTLERFFANDPKVNILRIKYSVVKEKVEWEDSKGKAPAEMGGEGVFPHIYVHDKRGLASEKIDSVAVWERNKEGKKDGRNWSEAVTKALAEPEPWLVY
ncbi:hypothetical protein C8R44DRAFT_721556 [Mycena epipterygia]|nr:hypothetical protein C8R44DRAFT_721556 [Mycena epipterygia]